MSLNINQQYDKIYRYCYFKTNNGHVSEDLTQETFLRYFSQNSYIDRGKPLAYLYVIANNLCTDYYKTEKAGFLTENIYAKEQFDNIETSYAVKQAVTTLPKDMQELLL